MPVAVEKESGEQLPWVAIPVMMQQPGVDPGCLERCLRTLGVASPAAGRCGTTMLHKYLLLLGDMVEDVAHT